jgi:hypothetical protein
MNINASDCIIFRDAPAYTEKTGLLTAQKSWRVELLYKEIRQYQDNAIVIAIIDACRTNVENIVSRGFLTKTKFNSHINLPYQTFIAYATSPQANASDGGQKPHSPYTEALISEIATLNQPIENTFKNVRKAVYKEPGNQLPWEHSCLVDNFSFNYGQLSKHYGCIYSSSAFKFQTNNLQDKLQQLICSGQYADFKNQVLIWSKELTQYSIDEQFLFGRILNNLATKSDKIITDFYNISFFRQTIQGETSHVLNGLLYNLYFTQNDDYRVHDFDINQIDAIDRIIAERDFKESLRFIRAELMNCNQHNVYTIGDVDFIKFNIEVKHSQEPNLDYKFLKKISCNKIKLDFLANLDRNVISYQDLRNILRIAAKVPNTHISIVGEGIPSNDIFILGDYNDIRIQDVLDTYFNSENHSSIDELCNHYEYNEISDFTVTASYISDDALIMEGDFEISTTLYLDNEEDTRYDVCLNGTYAITFGHEFVGKEFVLYPIDVQVEVDTSRLFN